MNWCLRKLQNKKLNVVISSFCHEVDEICALLDYYAAYSGTSLLMCRDELSIHLQGSRNQRRWPLKTGQMGCPKTSVRYYHYITSKKSAYLTSLMVCTVLCVIMVIMSQTRWWREYDTMQIKMIKPYKMLVTESQEKGPLLDLSVVKQCTHAYVQMHTSNRNTSNDKPSAKGTESIYL